jgi:hypothetical protein
VQQLEAASSSAKEVTPQVRASAGRPARRCGSSSCRAAAHGSALCLMPHGPPSACPSANLQSWSMTLRGANERLVPLGHDLTSGLYLSQKDPYKAGRWAGLAGAGRQLTGTRPAASGQSVCRMRAVAARCAPPTAAPKAHWALREPGHTSACRQLEVVGRPSAASLSSAAAGLGSVSPRSASTSSVGALRNSYSSGPNSTGASPMATHRCACGRGSLLPGDPPAGCEDPRC